LLGAIVGWSFSIRCRSGDRRRCAHHLSSSVLGPEKDRGEPSKSRTARGRSAASPRPSAPLRRLFMRMARPLGFASGREYEALAQAEGLEHHGPWLEPRPATGRAPGRHEGYRTAGCAHTARHLLSSSTWHLCTRDQRATQRLSVFGRSYWWMMSADRPAAHVQAGEDNANAPPTF